MSELNGFCSLKKRVEDAIKNKEVFWVEMNRNFRSGWCNGFHVPKRPLNYRNPRIPKHDDCVQVCIPFLHGNLLEFVNFEFKMELQRLSACGEYIESKTFQVVHKTISKNILYASIDDLDFLNVEIEPIGTKTKEKELIQRIYQMMDEDANALIPIFMEYYTDVYAPKKGFSVVEENH